LFNTINSIFVLIHKNPDKASDSLAKFSDLLRYQLYECNASKISVEQELNYLNNFIELGSLRLDNSVRCDFNLPQATNDQQDIAPFILMPFIENAFKHVSQTHLQDNWISIHITINGSSLYMEVSNSVAQVHNNTDVIKSNGIGLVNVKRRLALIYPNLHVLEISKELDRYRLRLQIQLDTTKELKAYPTVRELSFKVS